MEGSGDGTPFLDQGRPLDGLSSGQGDGAGAGLGRGRGAAGAGLGRVRGAASAARGRGRGAASDALGRGRGAPGAALGRGGSTPCAQIHGLGRGGLSPSAQIDGEPQQGDGSEQAQVTDGLGTLGCGGHPGGAQNLPFWPPRSESTNQMQQRANQGDSMDWNDEYSTLVCKLFAQQVLRGNRPNTHLNSVGYDGVMQTFRQITGIELSKRQLRNKWDKMKPDFVAWQKLMRRQTGTGWNNSKGVIVMDDEWWKKAKRDMPGCGKFRKKPLQNVEDLTIMFSDIINDASDHWNSMSENPIIPDEIEDFVGVEDEEVEEVPIDDMNEEVQEISPSIGNAKRRARVVLDKGKKPKTGTAFVIQEQITKIVDSAFSFTSKKSSEVTVQQIMELVIDCGAFIGSDEHFIATELFVKKDQRDMFMTLPNKESRLSWLRRKYNVKYGQT